MAHIRLTPAALNDLQEIKKYISEELCNPIAANRIVKEIIDDYMLLEISPDMGVSLSAKLHIQTDYRYLISKNYLIFYKADDENVSIYRILDGRMDYIKILLGEINNEQEIAD